MSSNESRCPSVDAVYEVLCRYYRVRQFRWLYEELFAELMGCSPSDPFARQAQASIRQQYPEFQRRASVLTSSGEVITHAVQRQAQAVVQICASGIRETWSRSERVGRGDALVLRPHAQPFNLLEKWGDPVWKTCGVYLWSIEYRGAYLASYVGQVCGSSRNFECRIWEEYNWWKDGNDRSLDIEKWKAGRRIELTSPPVGHLQRELDELAPIIRLWLIPLGDKEECDQAERWLVAELCKDPVTKQFLANRNPERYYPNSTWPVRIEAPASFRVVGLTVQPSALK